MLLEILAVVFTFICVYLTTKNRVSAWPVGIIGVVLYSIVFFQVQLYAEVILQIIFLIQSTYGWYNWSETKHKPPAPITKLTNLQRASWVGAIFAFTGILYNILIYTNASIPLVDSFTTSVSLVANWLLAERKLDNWYLWIFVDLIYVGMFAYKMLYLTSALYLIFFFMAMYGLHNWKKEYYEQEEKSYENHGGYGRDY